MFRYKDTLELIHVFLNKLVVAETVLTNIQQVTISNLGWDYGHSNSGFSWAVV
jgi:hypothetical protein